MTCGIYLLGFDGTEKVYVGQSVNIELRLITHKYKLKLGTHSTKMNLAYSTYGTPTLEILEVCTEDQLDTLENYHLKLWDAVENGFNTVSIANERPRLFGDSNPASLYSNEQIVSAMYLLISGEPLSFQKIADTVGISKQCVNHLANAHKYLWLKEVYPQEYTILMSLKGTRPIGKPGAKLQGIIYPNIVSPEGVVYEVDNIRQFSKLHGLDDTHLGKVLNYKAKSHKGWKRVEIRG
jgi:predicted XRE-type DNA-binding protein